MRALQTATSVLFLACAAGAVAGVLRNRRYRDCWSFALYLLTVLACEGAVVLWPQRFFTWWFFVAKQAVYDLLKVGVALEVARHAFLVYPGARATARWLLLAVLVASTTLIGLSSYDLQQWSNWQPPVVSATIWLFTATAAVVLWYRLPLHAWDRAILAGFTPYLLVFVSLLSVLQKHGARSVYAGLGLVDSMAYLAVMAWWAVAAWRPYPAPELAAHVVDRLGLEGVRGTAGARAAWARIE